MLSLYFLINQKTGAILFDKDKIQIKLEYKKITKNLTFKSLDTDIQPTFFKEKFKKIGNLRYKI